ncbi:hypothetical protein E1292_14010 [Nonomuraea deserti]|uniref:Uncharacterized protein n=1 Tax=Nonomuraea deserti TaxID=1848322 RepID=A0A4R4VMT9_9ACTN|nr:hypothetical protein E1292_14010 [Nonomuraea deserti]
MVFTVAQAVVFPATVVIAAGLQAGGPPIRARRALRVALRRLPSMLLLVLLAVPVYALVAAAGFGALLVTGSLVPAVFVFAGLALFTMPALLAVPAIVLEGRSAPAAVGRGYDLVIGHGPSSAFTLACGVYVIPGAVFQALDAAVAGLHGPTFMYASGLAGGVLALAGTTFQASVVTRQFLHRLAPRPDPVSAEEFDRILAGLPAAGRRRQLRFPFVLPALVLPGLVYGGVATVNPFGWLETSETDVTAAWRDSFGDGVGAPKLGRGGLRACTWGWARGWSRWSTARIPEAVRDIRVLRPHLSPGPPALRRGGRGPGPRCRRCRGGAAGRPNGADLVGRGTAPSGTPGRVSGC